MELTDSWKRVIPPTVAERYDFVETRDAAAVMASTTPAEFNDLVAALDAFSLYDSDILAAGGNETDIASRLNHGFRERGRSSSTS